jgi:hypothetical protein
MEDMYVNLLDLSLIVFLTFISAWCLITYKFGDWRNWRLYYPTILFFWCGNLIGFFVFHDHLLWEFKSNMLSHGAIDLIDMLFVFTCTTILFLQYYPKRIIKQILYILLWVLIYSIIELIFHFMGGITYHYGWSIWWSLSHNIYQFIFLRVHYKNPILAWIFAFIALGITMVIVKVSL